MLSANNKRFPAHCPHRGFRPSRHLLEEAQNFGQTMLEVPRGVDDEFLAARGNASFDLSDHNNGRSWWILSLSDHEMTEFRIWRSLGSLAVKSGLWTLACLCIC